MRKYYFLLFFIVSNLIFGQDCYLDKTNDLIDNDFSSIWIGNTFQGVIGNNNLRIEVRFTKITQDKDSAKIYLVNGKSKVRDNICDFSGRFVIEEILKIDLSNPDCNGPFPDGKIIGNYFLKEDSSQYHVGEFSGEFSSNWFQTNQKFVSAEGLYSDEGMNIFLGKWESYDKAKNLKCSWGIQIPPEFSDGLFIKLENEFYNFNLKYIPNGWQSYILSNLGSFILLADSINFSSTEIEKAKNLEAIQWWKSNGIQK